MEVLRDDPRAADLVRSFSELLPSRTFFAPLSTWFVPAFTFESSAARTNPDTSRESGTTNTMTNTSRFIGIPLLTGSIAVVEQADLAPGESLLLTD
jgi:hypothetical protein